MAASLTMSRSWFLHAKLEETGTVREKVSENALLLQLQGISLTAGKDHGQN